jgi:hypothetical protein
MASDFEKEINEASKNLNSAGKDSIDWYKNQINDMNKKPKLKPISSPEIGKMYLYAYDAKYKDILPFFDKFPLVLPIKFENSGFLGLNLHYLPPNARASLLNSLTSLNNNNKYDDTTKMVISYDLLKGYSQFSGYETCLKRYLYGQIRSQFYYISSADWSKVVLLPLQKWHINTNAKYAGSPPY